MTEEQYKKYGNMYSELQPVKTFLEWCGDRYKNQVTRKFDFKIIAKAKNLFLYRKFYAANIEENTYEIPEDLQKRIVIVIEDWVEEKENEMKNI